ncbi:DUF1772 domain-containing protein [Paractinoplanes lichenicola]|uniref:DUF1772 domain-containing protein n=1 Tax=Paractinoplanes lichenicola TaxID=2802976 RepID=A0ABS1VV80_9ACTN|nr:DUF1772 domain-containing protein [Actinoplanes lichenicola]MBL7258354.1 DUF1772 domain-containing protein [Actinoplanes lichenicola]
MLSALQVVTIVSVGLLVGVELAVALVLNRILDALPEDAGQLGRAHGGRMLGAAMPVWYIGSLILVVIWAVADWGDDGTGLVIASGALLILSVIMSLLLLVPINNRSKKWTPENRPADWKEQGKRWDRLHYVRVAIIVGAFALLPAALV